MLTRRAGCLLCAAVLLLFAACSSTPSKTGKGATACSQASAAVSFELTLPFSAKDVLNPFTAKTKQNQELSHLLFDPLVKATDTFEPAYYLAESIRQEGQTLTIALRAVTFTDGSPLTADDVVYSLTQAKAEGSHYAEKLSNVSRVSAADSKTVVVELVHGDPQFAVNLDCPILKQGTASLTNENNLAVPPIGCGRYTLQNDNGTYTLVANPSYYRGTIGQSVICLVDCPDEDSLSHYLSIGQISMVYSDLSDAAIPKLTGATTKTVSSSLVYLGINNASALTADGRMRQAISFALDRDALCREAYFGYALPATNLFHPAWAAIGGLKSIDEQPNEQLTVAYWEELGYNNLDEQGYRVNQSGDRLSLQLLCNEENAARNAAAARIADQLKRFGVAIELQSVPFEEYHRRLQSGQFELYLGEVRLANSMDVYPLFNRGDIVYGLPAESQARVAFNAYYAGEGDLLNAVSAFVSEMPFLPLCYRSGVILSSPKLQPLLSYSPSDLFNGIEQLQ